MAETTIFEVNVQSALKSLADLQAAISLNKQAQSEYQKVVNSGADITGEAAKRVEELKVAQKNLSSEYRSGQRLVEGFTGAQKKGLDTTNNFANSVRQNRLLLKQLTEQYNDASDSARANLIPTIKTLSDKLKEQEAAIGDTRRNVGNYKEAIIDSFQGLKSLAGGLSNATDGFKAAGGGVKGFSAALATTGIPIVVFAMQQLFDVFKSFKPVADAVENSVTALKAAFGALISGNNIKEAATQSLALLNIMRDLEDTQAAYNLSLQRNNNAIEKLIIQSKDRTKTEAERKKLLEDAEKLEKENFESSKARNDKKLTGIKDELKQRFGLSEGQLKLIAETDDAENVAFQNLKSRLEKEKNLQDRDLVNYREALQEKLSIEGDSNKALEKLTNSKNKLIEKEEEAREKANAKEAARLEKLKEAQKKYREDLVKLADEFLLTEREKLSKGFTDKIKDLKDGGEREIQIAAAIEKQRELALKKFDEARRQNREDERKRIENEQIAIRKKELDELLASNNAKLAIELRDVDLSIDGEASKARRKLIIQLEYFNQQLKIAEKLAELDKSGTDAAILNIQKIKQEIQGIQQLLDKPSKATLGDSLGISKEQLKEAGEALQGVQTAFNGISQVISANYQVRLNEIENTKKAEIEAVRKSGASEEEKQKRIQAIEKKSAKEAYELQKEQFETNKALQIVNAVIAGALGVVNAFQLGPIAGAIAAVAIAATTAAQIAVIASQQAPSPPAFAKGIIGLNGAGTATSDSIDARLSRGESVITAKATARYAPILADMERSVGNTPNMGLFKGGKFAGGVVGLSDGGFAARGMSSGADQAAFMQAAIRQGFMSAPQPVVSVEEFRTVSNGVDRSVSVSEL